MYTIRQATPGDLPQLLAFEQELINVERPMDPTIRDGQISYYDIKTLIEDDNALVIVATHGNEIVASGHARIKTDRHYLKHEKMGYLGFMFVSETHRGKGLNARIIKTLTDWCRDQGLDEIRLDVYEENPSAIRAYEKVGFKKHLITMRLVNDKTNLNV